MEIDITMEQATKTIVRLHKANISLVTEINMISKQLKELTAKYEGVLANLEIDDES